MTTDIKDGGLPSKKTHKTLDPVAQFPASFANDHHTYIARKAERLSTAVHMVTGFVDAQEPLRASLRRAALSVLEWCTDLEALNRHGVDALAARAALIGSYLGTAESSGMVSTMNAKLIVDEYARLAVFVRERYSIIRSGTLDTATAQPEQSKGQKDMAIYRTIQKSIVSDIPNSQTSRKSDILGILNTKDRISIKDVTNVIADVSEKTVQRELLAMVADGTLIKEGERRWSTYKLRGAHPKV